MIKACPKVFVILGLSLFSMMPSLDAKAEIFKCVNSKAEVYYNDKPCHVWDIERQIKSMKDPVGGYIAPTTFKEEKKRTRKFVVVREKENTVSNNHSNTDLEKATGANQNLESQVDSSTEATSKDYLTAGSNSNSRKYESDDGVMMTEQEFRKTNPFL